MLNKRISWGQLLLVAGLLCGIAVMFTPTDLGAARQNYYRTQCQENLREIGLAYQQYTQDYNDRFPPNASGGAVWVAPLRPYLKTDKLFTCPSCNSSRDGSSSDYFVNTRVGGLPISRLKSMNLTILNGDGTPGASLNLSELPHAWLRDENSPARRHLDGANYAFADGHIKWIRPEKLTAKPIKSGSFTFLPF